MSKSVTVFNIRASGHVNPTLAVVRALVARGYTVYYFAYVEVKERIESAGAHFIAYGDKEFNVGKFNDLPIHEVPMMDRAHWFKMSLMKAARPIAELVLEQVREQAPEFIITDTFAAWGVLVGKLLDSFEPLNLLIPVISSISSYPSPRHKHVMESPEPFISGIQEAVREANALDPKLENCLRAEDGMNAMSDYNICYSIPDLCPDFSPRDASINYLGVAIAPREPDGTFPWDKLNASSLVVYISLGTVVSKEMSENTMPKILEMMQQLTEINGKPVQFVLATGEFVVAAEELPSNCIARKYVPQLEVLERYAAVFVSHCGFNSVNEGVFYGVPFVCLPVFADQPVNAATLASREMAMQLDTRTFTTEELVRAVTTVLTNPSYKEKAMELSRTMRESTSIENGVGEMIEWAAAQRSNA